MYFARFAGFDDEADRGAQAGADQVVMHRGAGQQRRDWKAVRAGHAIGQDDDVDAFTHRSFGAGAQFIQHLLHARRAETAWKVVSRVRETKCDSATSVIERIFSRSWSVRIG